MRIHLNTGPRIAVPVFLLALSIDLAHSMLFPSDGASARSDADEAVRIFRAEPSDDGSHESIALRVGALEGTDSAQLWQLAIIVCGATGQDPTR